MTGRCGGSTDMSGSKRQYLIQKIIIANEGTPYDEIVKAAETGEGVDGRRLGKGGLTIFKRVIMEAFAVSLSILT